MGDPNPDPQGEDLYSRWSADPLTLAINSVRGEALEAIVAYALWCARNLHPEDPSLEKVPQFLEVAPEVLVVLEKHLDRSVDRSLAIRAVYGERLPALGLLAPQWLRDNMSLIFPPEEEQRELREAAWGAYVIFNPPYDSVFAVARDEYAAAVERLGQPSASRWMTGDPEKRLAEHLVQLFARSRIDLEDPLLTGFFEEAAVSVRAAAIRDVGHGLGEITGPPADTVEDRLRDLWVYRLSAARENAKAEDPNEELAAFGLWFASGKFDAAWSLECFRETLELTNGRAASHWGVPKRLSALCEGYPQETVECLELAVFGASEAQQVLLLSEPVRVVLATALASSSDAAKAAAKRILDEVERRGLRGYEDLVSPP